MSVLQCSVPTAQAWRVPLLCIQRQQGVSTILACGCAWHVAAQLCGVVTAGDFAGYRARWTPATCGRGESAVVFDVTLRRRRFRQGKAYGPSVLVTGSAPVLNGASALTQSLTSVALTLISVRTCCVLHGEVRTLIWSFAQNFGRQAVRVAVRICVRIGLCEPRNPVRNGDRKKPGARPGRGWSGGGGQAGGGRPRARASITSLQTASRPAR